MLPATAIELSCGRSRAHAGLPFVGSIDVDLLTQWRGATTAPAGELLDKLDLQFGSRVVKESALMWPV